MMRRTTLAAVALALLAACTRQGAESQAPEPQVATPAAVARPHDPAVAEALERRTGSPDPAPEIVVALALDEARQAFGRQLLARLDAQTVDEGARQDIEATFVFTSNVHAELDDCGCRSHPLGGLDRVATLMDHIDTGVETPVFRVDTGNSLGRFDRTLSTEHIDQTGAHAVVDAFSTIGIGAMPLGTHDLSLGREELQQALAAAQFAPLASNLEIDGRSPFPSTVVAEVDGVRVGYVGIVDAADPAPDWLAETYTLTDPVDAAAAGIDALRNQRVDMVVLLGTGGVDRTAAVLARLEALGKLPDLALVSGSGQKSFEPAFASGVPIFEAADRGRFVMQIDIHGFRGQRQIYSATTPLAELVRDWVSTVTVVGTTERNIRRYEGQEGEEGRIASYAALLETQVAQQRALETQIRAASPWRPGTVAAERVSTVQVTAHEVVLDLERHPRVARLIDAAFEAGARH